MAREKVDSEEAIIGEFWVPLAEAFPGAFALQDDCAAINPGAGRDLIVTTDAVIAGVHFFPDEDAGAVAWKALAVNVSDLIGKGATPLAYVMSLALPEAPERTWLSSFAGGLRRAQEAFACRLAGGDTDRTPGPLSVSVTAFGTVPAGTMVRRATARPGDHVYVSGTIGDATLGLALRRDPTLAARWGIDAGVQAQLAAAYRMPEPPTALAEAVRTLARAAMDVSDGLVKDFERMCRAAGVGGRLEAERVPLSSPARAVLGSGGATLADLLTGGEDYQVLAAVAPERAQAFEQLASAAGVPVTHIGAIAQAAAGVEVVGADNRAITFTMSGWDHFRAPGGTQSRKGA